VNRLPFLRPALIGACVAAMMVAGCGRKGALDPPPGAWVGSGITPANAQTAQPGPDTADEKPIAPEGPNRRIPADWLIE
jgi:predicted small lipoprotein YifL